MLSAAPKLPLRSQEVDFPPVPSTTPLFNRRRANTTSIIPPPLTVVTSSLSNWNGQASASTGNLPSLAQPSVTQSPLPLQHSAASSTPSVSELPMLPSPTSQITIQSFEMDIDRTPRCSDFPRDVQNLPRAIRDVYKRQIYPLNRCRYPASYHTQNI